jgi:hypothetical protein
MRRLLEMFENHKNCLARPQLWHDTFENLLLRSPVEIDGKLGSFGFANDLYGQSWTLEGYSDAMWRIYSSDQKGIRIRTTIGKLLDSLSAPDKTHDATSCFIGKVEYLDERKLRRFASEHFLNGIGADGKKVAQTLLVKRNAFRHEKEVRLIYYSPTPTEPHAHIYCHNFDCHHAIEQIMVHPQLTDQEAQVLIAGIKTVTGFKGELLQSGLYRLPKSFKATIRSH